MMLRPLPQYERLSALASRYDLILCDIWGVVHNGAAIYAEAAGALSHFRDRGGSVILISNASRLRRMVSSQLGELGVPLAAYDAVITSGDVTREYIAARPRCAVFDVGPGDAGPILEGLNVRFATMNDADLVISSGAFDSANKKIEGLRPQLFDMRAKDLLLLCANPDVITELGGRRVQCSGALAELYAELGGRVIYAGKPKARIYERALSLAAELRGAPVPRERVLVIGDSLRTDIAGAVASGFASLFVWGGIHAGELGANPTPTVLARLFTKAQLLPTAVTSQLVW